MSRIVIRGGTVLDQTGERRADVAIDDGRIVEVGRRTGRRPRRSTPRAASFPRASSTCTCTCASRAAKKPRRSRPAAAPPRSAGSPRSSRCRTPSPRRTSLAVIEFVRAQGPTCRVVRGAPGRLHHGRTATASSWHRSASWPRRACTCSPTTATVCRTRSSCGARSSTPSRSTSPWRSIARSPRSPRAPSCTRVRAAASSACPAGRRSPRS